MADAKPERTTTDYSASQAPETQESAHRDREQDHRAIPGGDPARATRAYGMESLDRDDRPSTNLDQMTVEDSNEPQAPPARPGQQ